MSGDTTTSEPAVYTIRGTPVDVDSIADEYSGEDEPVTMTALARTEEPGTHWRASYGDVLDDGETGGMAAIYEDVRDQMYLVVERPTDAVYESPDLKELVDGLILERPVPPENAEDLDHVSAELE